jgi:hypothetical protein
MTSSKLQISSKPQAPSSKPQTDLKLQAPNLKQMTSSKLQTSKPVGRTPELPVDAWRFEDCDLALEICLRFEFWDLKFLRPLATI